MTYFFPEVQTRLQQAFIQNNLSIDVQPDHFEVENSQNQIEAQTEGKIRKIVSSLGFYPVISKNRINNNFVFTMTPYTIPEFFAQKQVSKSSSDIQTLVTPKKVEIKSNYFKIHEIEELVKSFTFVSKEELVVPQDRWAGLNDCRAFVTSALSNAVSEIILKNIQSHAPIDAPIIEIGSGIGYTLSEDLRSKTITTQPNVSDCQLLQASIRDPIYQLDIEGIYNSLISSQKKVSLFFALNVFDTLSVADRKKSFSQISQLQNSGDRILIMLDTNPFLNVILEHLESLYPEHAIFPYYLTDPSKFSVIIVPIEHSPSPKLSINKFIEAMKLEYRERMLHGGASSMQYVLHDLQKEFNLKVICLEDVFVKQVRQELHEAGYKSNVYYHASFQIEDRHKNTSHIEKDLLYKGITDHPTVRGCSVTNEELLSSLDQKGLRVPEEFNEAFLLELRKKGRKIGGAEILVVEATKL